jgi:hypothetical protein
MLSELLNKLSGSQITLIILAMIFVPGTVVAAVSFQPVAIVDPVTGKQSLVDSSRRLAVYDSITALRNHPANLVRITVSNNGSQCEAAQQYTIPNGKAFVLTSITGYMWCTDCSWTYTGFVVSDAANCVGYMLEPRFASISVASPVTPVAVDFGSGVPVAAGKTISVRSLNNSGYTVLHGYLVPASVVPAMASAGSETNPTPVTAAQALAKMTRH